MQSVVPLLVLLREGLLLLDLMHLLVLLGGLKLLKMLLLWWEHGLLPLRDAV